VVTANTYDRQVRLLTRILPLVAAEPCFALKGGTAINLFIRDMPRLSVDIDLVYLPADDRETALARTAQALSRIADAVKTAMPRAEIIRSYEQQNDALRLFVDDDGVRVKIELSPVLRGSVFAPELRAVSAAVEERYGFAEMQLLSLPDLYAGKICAALDRQHPRDLFDVKLLLENEGIDDDLVRTFLVYLISHNRTMAELLQPVRKDIAGLYAGEFQSMARLEVPLDILLDVREQLIAVIRKSLNDDYKQFLLSFKAGVPDWSLLGLEGVEHLPAVRWKLFNLDRMSPDRRATLLANLEDVLADCA
jgi:predicted nucleotidyltransferase component of viral defense system